MPFSNATIIPGHYYPFISLPTLCVFLYGPTTIYNSFICCLLIHLGSVFQAGGKKRRCVFPTILFPATSMVSST